jgi:hypothetical protein
MLLTKQIQVVCLTWMFIFLSLVLTGEVLAAAGADNQQMMVAARNFVKAHSVKGMTFSLTLKKRAREYALVEANPTGKWNQVDAAMVVMQKIGSSWVAQAMGSYLPEWEEEVPELFR